MSCPKTLVLLCHGCHSGDVGWCDVSKRPYCNECNMWGRVNYGTPQDAIRQWHANLKDKQGYTEYELNEMFRIQNQDIDIEIDNKKNIEKIKSIFNKEIPDITKRLLEAQYLDTIDDISSEIDRIGKEIRNIAALITIKGASKVIKK